MQVPIVVPKVVECTQHGVDTVSTRQQCFVAKGLKDKETPETDTQEADAEAVENFCCSVRQAMQINTARCQIFWELAIPFASFCCGK